MTNRIKLTLATAGGVAAVASLAAAGSSWHSGTFPQWVEALATLAAFGAALVAANFAAAVFRLEDARDDRRLEAELREQAEKVAAWVKPRGTQWSGSTYSAGYELQIRNGSDLPVYDVTITATLSLAAGGEDVLDVQTRRFPVLAPTMQGIENYQLKGLHLEMPDPFSELDPPEQAAIFKTMVREQNVLIDFRDSGGRRWIRHSNGVLAELPDD